MSVRLSVVLPTYNPQMDYLQSVLDGLRAQTLPACEWDLLVVDNKSEPPLRGRMDLSWHSGSDVIREEAPGKMRAMLAAFAQVRSDLMVFLDDDTVLAPDYLEQAVRIGRDFPLLGTWSGRVELELEDPAQHPPQRLRHLLSERLIETAVWSNDPNHPQSTPWGGGMCIRRIVAEAYVRATTTNPARLKLDPMGDQPGYGGDTDLAYTGCSIGLGMGVFPQLRITHLIPKRRSTLEYLIRNLEAHTYSELLHNWTLNGVAPGRPGLRARMAGRLRWFIADSVGRQIIDAKQRSRLAAMRTIATGMDSRPMTHR